MSTIIGEKKPSPDTFRDGLRDALVRLPIAESAPLLLGCDLVSEGCRARLVEVEAYWDERDPGSHAWRGPTQRTQVMYGEPGRAFVYFTYGNHWLLNVVGRPQGEAGAVLLRAAEPLDGLSVMRTRRSKAVRDEDLLSGPGKLTQAFGVDARHNTLDLLDPASPVCLEPGVRVERILVGKRVGLSPGRGQETPWRFVDADRARWSSKPRLLTQPSI